MRASASRRDRVLHTPRVFCGQHTRNGLDRAPRGEEFVVVLPATDAETAHNICERIVMAFARSRLLTSRQVSVHRLKRMAIKFILQLHRLSKRPTKRLYTAQNPRPQPPVPSTTTYRRRCPLARSFSLPSYVQIDEELRHSFAICLLLPVR